MNRTLANVLLAFTLALGGCGDDSSETDAQVSDATVADAFVSDASEPDAPEHDASTTDAAPETDARSIDTGPTPAAGPRYVGRVDDADASAVRFGWPGTGVILRFDGTGARARLADSGGFLTVVVDGEVTERIELGGGEQLYNLASGLPPGEHTVQLYKRTEGFVGTCTLTGVEVDGTLLSVPAPSRFIEVIGDSITCGYGNEGADQNCDFSADTENHYMTYAAIAARGAGAELSTVAWSGKGLVNNYGDDTNEPMPELYDRLIPNEEGDYDFGRRADVVVINLGTNDFSTAGDPDEEFTAAYTQFLAHVRTRHPDAMILTTIAPLLGGNDYERAFGYVQSAVEARAAAGDARVQRFDMRVDAVGWGCDYHPSIATHQAMAARLSEVLSETVGW